MEMRLLLPMKPRSSRNKTAEQRGGQQEQVKCYGNIGRKVTILEVWDTGRVEKAMSLFKAESMETYGRGNSTITVGQGHRCEERPCFYGQRYLVC